MILARSLVVLVGALLLAGCSIKRYAVNKVGDTLASGSSVFETDNDVVLVGEALPFSIKFVESLLAESPRHEGLLLTAARALVLYSYGYVHFEAETLRSEDLDKANRILRRAHRLYLRGLGYGMRALEKREPGFEQHLRQEPAAAAQRLDDNDIPLLYWTAAALGLAVSSNANDPAMLARLPEVEALIGRGQALDPAWDHGAFHEFQITLAASRPGQADEEQIRRHYEIALQLSEGRRAAPHVAYAEAVAEPNQDREMFRELLEKALAVDADEYPQVRLVNLLAQRRARWLLGRIDELFLVSGETQPAVTAVE